MAAAAIHGQMPRNLPQSALRLLAAPFRALGRLAGFLAEGDRLRRELERLSRLSDRELAARGLSRDGEIRRILGTSAFI